MRVLLARVLGRAMLRAEPLMRSLHLMRLWSISVRLTRRRGVPVTKTVYGPVLSTDWEDHQFYLCVTGRSGFKLYDILQERRDSDFVFVDVGANIGLYSLLASGNAHCVRAYALEPNPTVFRNLLGNIDHNRATGVEAIKLGIADENGAKTFFFKDWHRGLGNFLERGDHRLDVHVRDFSLLDEICD